MRKPNLHVTRACKLVGSQSSLAALLNVKAPTVNQWVKGVRPVPANYCKAISQATKGEVSLRELRPDDWQKYWPELATPPAHSAQPAIETAAAWDGTDRRRTTVEVVPVAGLSLVERRANQPLGQRAREQSAIEKVATAGN